MPRSRLRSTTARRKVLIDPTVNLLEVRRSLAHADWIVPLTTPLKPSWQRNPNDQAPMTNAVEE